MQGSQIAWESLDIIENSLTSDGLYKVIFMCANTRNNLASYSWKMRIDRQDFLIADNIGLEQCPECCIHFFSDQTHECNEYPTCSVCNEIYCKRYEIEGSLCVSTPKCAECNHYQQPSRSHPTNHLTWCNTVNFFRQMALRNSIIEYNTIRIVSFSLPLVLRDRDEVLDRN